MANFYNDNSDIRFLFKHIDLRSISALQEENFRFAGDFDYAPKDSDEAIRNYEMVLESLGQLAAEFIAPRAEQVDKDGNILNPNGTVSYAKGIRESLEQLAKADVMGFTLPYRFGGLNFPNVIYSMAIEMVSRADASLMNIFGLQGIAETINAFASEEIKQKYLYRFSKGEVTGAMVLTEPDAGSDLQAVKTAGYQKAAVYQDAEGKWFLHGVKRFITNGCGEVLLVLARSEPDRSGGLGLSLFVCDRGPTVHIRRLEEKLGIHGSPTCEIFFDNTPCELIGERQRGLVTYVMSLMNGARIGIAAQSMGIAEAAYNLARDYAASRRQFGVAIEKLPAVRDMLIEDEIAIEAGRAVLYETSRIVDLEISYTKMTEMNMPEDKEKAKELRNTLKKYSRFASLLTPMSKYYCSEMCNRVAYDAIQILGGSGYMRDYAAERYYRDARITTIYEGTSQLQVIAAVRGVCSGTAEKFMTELAAMEYDEAVKDLLAKLASGVEQLKKTVVFVKENGNEYMDLNGRAIVDIAFDLIAGYLFCGQSSTKADMQIPVSSAGGKPDEQMISMKERKGKIARRFINKAMPRITSLAEQICSGDKSTFSEYEKIVPPIPGE
jgi:alkylation response protein AidB-like acyl-CoA dehydrogenase